METTRRKWLDNLLPRYYIPPRFLIKKEQYAACHMQSIISSKQLLGSQDLGLSFQMHKIVFDFEQSARGKRIGRWKSMNQTLFSTKSTTLNPMVKSDLVTSGDGTVLNLILRGRKIKVQSFEYSSFNILFRHLLNNNCSFYWIQFCILDRFAMNVQAT